MNANYMRRTTSKRWTPRRTSRRSPPCPSWKRAAAITLRYDRAVRQRQKHAVCRQRLRYAPRHEKRRLILVVLPDGQWLEFSSVPTAISISLSGGGYAFSAATKRKRNRSPQPLCRSSERNELARRPLPLITAGAGCRCWYTARAKTFPTSAWTAKRITWDIIAGDTSLVGLPPAFTTARPILSRWQRLKFISV